MINHDVPIFSLWDMPLFYGLNSSQARKLIDVGPSPLFFRWGKSCPNDIWLVSNLFDPKMTSRFLSVKSWKPPVLISHVSLYFTHHPISDHPTKHPTYPNSIHSIHSIHTSHHSFIDRAEEHLRIHLGCGFGGPCLGFIHCRTHLWRSGLPGGLGWSRSNGFLWMCKEENGLEKCRCMNLYEFMDDLSKSCLVFWCGWL